MESKSKHLTSIRRKSDFENLFKRGKKLRINSWLTLVFIKNDFDSLRLGISISRQVGKSVVRNRLKRWIRIFFRQQVEKYPGVDVNVLLKARNDSFYQEIKHIEFSKELEKAIKSIPISQT